MFDERVNNEIENKSTCGTSPFKCDKMKEIFTKLI